MNDCDLKKIFAEEKIEQVNLRFVRAMGGWGQLSLNAKELDPQIFQKGIKVPFDEGSKSAEKNNAHRYLLPEWNFASLDPFSPYPTLNLLCRAWDSKSKMPLAQDPREFVKRSVKMMKEKWPLESIKISARIQFSVFDKVRYSNQEQSSVMEVDSYEAHWNSASTAWQNLGHQAQKSKAEECAAPRDSLEELRSEIVHQLGLLGVSCSFHRHGKSVGQCEVGLSSVDIELFGDSVDILRHVVKNVSLRHNKTATFMPCPLADGAGNKSAWSLSLEKNGKNLLDDKKNQLLFKEGVWTHIKALQAFLKPTTNSYRCIESVSSEEQEFIGADSAFHAQYAPVCWLLAGLDGLFSLPNKKKNNASKQENAQASSFAQALNALDEERDFWLSFGVWDRAQLDSWIKNKLISEVQSLERRPHPWEFELYYSL